MAEASSEPRRRPVLPWELRLANVLPLPAFARGALLAALLLLGFALEQWLHGFPSWSPPAGSRFPYTAVTHAAAMAAALFGYFTGAYAYVFEATRSDLAEIGGEAPLEDLLSPSRWAGLVAIAVLWIWLGAAVGPIATGDLAAPFRGGAVTPLVGYFLSAWVFGRLVHFTARGARLAADAAAASVRIDVWNPRPLRRFGRIGLRLSLVWIVGVTLFSLTLLTDPNPEDVPTRWPVMVLSIGLAVAALLLPVWGVRRRIQLAKAAEIERLDDEIRVAREASSGTAPGRISDLLAMRTHVDAVSEWPFDAPTLTRFVLLLLIPLGSWLGGAFVERALSALLD